MCRVREKVELEVQIILRYIKSLTKEDLEAVYFHSENVGKLSRSRASPYSVASAGQKNGHRRAFHLRGALSALVPTNGVNYYIKKHGGKPQRYLQLLLFETYFPRPNMS